MDSNSWDAAIADAKRQIAKLQGKDSRQIAKLERAIQTCEEEKTAGEPWPGDERVRRSA